MEKKHGWFMTINSVGDKQVGEYKEGLEDGDWTLTRNDGSIVSQTWKLG
jgi:hypothetical protein